ncbi:MAG: ABC transporter ATP-binding protein [Nitrososphaerales archaeon]
MNFILECIGLKKYFGDVKAIDDVNLKVKSGEITSILGPNGAGKTTLINLITGWLNPDTGKILFDGFDVTSVPPHDRVKRGICRSFQLVNLYDEMSVLDNISIAILSRKKLTGSLFKPLKHYKDVEEEAYSILKKIGLENRAHELAINLPHGSRKLLDVGLALALQPKLLLLDEPTSGVATREKTQVMHILSSIVRETKVTALMVEHDVDLAFAYSSEVVVMSQGKIIAQGPPEVVKKVEEVIKLGYGK